MRGLRSGRHGSIALTGLVGLVVALGSPARAADDGYANVFSSLFSAVGIVKPDAPPEIAYRERPPLVLPPQAGLPKPAETATRTAAWPKDPDVVRHRKESDEARAPENYNRQADIVSQDELRKGRGPGDAFQPGECNVNANNRTCLLVSPDELKAQSDRFNADNPDKGDEVVAGQEPDRVYLTQPPKGYLKATRTVKATAEAPVKRIDEANPRAFLQPADKTDE